MNVLVLGGYGYFGAGICAAISKIPSCRVTVAGRDGVRARALAGSLGADAAALDIDADDFPGRLLEARPDLVISTVGPFQARDYRVPRAALAAGAHYADIADARAFVCEIGALDAEARAADRLVVSGASSVPALSSAVVDRYAGEFGDLGSIEIAISSSARVPGHATLASVLGCCGRPLARRDDGASRTVYGGGNLRTHRFSSPPMTRWIGDGDVPDLDLLPARHPSVRSVRFGAGVELAPLQWGVRAMASLVRAGWIRDASRWTPALAAVARMVQPFGSGRSGMFVRLEGADPHGRPLRRHWEITAEGEDGRSIPCAGAIALARKLATAGIGARGAMPCVGLVTLAEYLHELEGRNVHAHESR